MAEIVQSLFGITPDMYQQSQQARADQQAMQYARLSPFEQANFAIGRGANMLGGAVGRGLGGEDPELARITMRQQIASQINYADPKSIMQGVELLAKANDTQGAMYLADVGRKAESEQALTQSRIAQANREAKQAVPNDIQIANEIASLETSLLNIENTPDSPDRTQAKNLLNSRLSALRSLTSKGDKAVAANIKEVGVAEKSREPVYLDVNNDQQFIYKLGADGKQVRVPFTGGVDRTTSKTDVGVKLPEGESEFIKQLAKEDAQELSKARSTSKAASEELKSLQKLQQLNQQQLVSGSFATNRVGVLNFLNTLGMTSGKDAKTLANSEQYSKVTGDLLLDKIKKLGTQPSSTDREFIAKILPQLENSPAARQQLINYLANRANEVVSEVRAMDTYARKNRGLGGYMPNIPLVGQTPDVSTMSTEELQRIARGQKP